MYRSQRLLIMVDWSRLPYDLIALIANKLCAVEDFMAFSAVCRSWRCIYLDKNWNPSNTLPWLMLDESHSSEVPTRGFLSVDKKKINKLVLPEIHARQRCWGTSHGWLLTINYDLEISLLNPITRDCINLPSYSTLNNNGQANIDWFSFIHKATVLRMQNRFVAVVIYGPRYSLAFARSGDSAWTTVQSPNHFLFVDAVGFKDQILALSMVGTFVHVKIDGPDPPRVVYIASPPTHERPWQQIYLAELSGSLSMVLRYRNGFRVYRFDFNSKEWILMASLGDHALFLDDAYCFSCSALGDLECNSIYFANENLECYLSGQQQGIKMHRINCETGEIVPWFLSSFGENSPHYSCPIWVTPTLW